jgi:nucleoside-diphosphate-sugar epimerase
MNILVTGSSGFIARFLIPMLTAAGHAVVGIDKRVGPSYGSGFRFIHGNILDERDVEGALQEMDAIIHLAAEHKDFGVPEKLYYEVNVAGTEMLLERASRIELGKFVFFSSVAVYGDQSTPTDESTSPHPDSHYGKSKLLAEHRISAWASQDGSRRAVILRPTVIFGPYNYANMYRLIASVAKGRYIGVGNGDNIKSIGYVENVAAAAMHLMERMKPGIETFNFADSPHMTTRELVECIAKSLGVKLSSLRIPKPLALTCAFPFDVIARVTGLDMPLTAKRIDKFTTPTHHRAEEIRRVGFAPLCSLEEGIRRMTAWYSDASRIPPPSDVGSDGA